MPDALSKTIPVWCTVLNELLFPGLPRHKLYTPPQVVSQSERAQIIALLSSFLTSLEVLNLSIESFKSQVSKPLRPIWITPDSSLTPTESVFEEFHPIICCTVSRMSTGREPSEAGYIQGAGDDTENWACGLTPSVFWTNHLALLTASENDLPGLIKQLVLQFESSGYISNVKVLKPTSCLFVGTLNETTNADYGCVVTLLPKVTNQSTWRRSAGCLDVGLGPHKVGSRNLRIALPAIVTFVKARLIAVKEKSKERGIIIACESGKDLSIGVALALLCLLFAENGALLEEVHRFDINKTFIRRRLGWISVSVPDANPSRTTLQSVNSFLMDRP